MSDRESTSPTTTCIAPVECTRKFSESKNMCSLFNKFEKMNLQDSISFRYRLHDNTSPSSPPFDWKEKFKRKFCGFSMPFIDSHCHLDFLFDRVHFQGTFENFRQQNKETFPENFSGCIAVFCNPASFIPQEGLWFDLVMDIKSTIYIAMGCHPKHAFRLNDTLFNNLKICVQHPRVVAVGEIGLDYSGTFYQHKEVQQSVFIKQLKFAIEVKKPIVIHCRDAENDCLKIMEKIVPTNYKIHLHCFTGNYASCKKWLNKFSNLYIGLTPLVTYTTAKPIQEVAQNISLDKLLLETDAPYFVPSTVPRNELPVSHPGMAVVVAVEVARLKNISVETVLSHCLSNTKNMYMI